MDKQGEELGAQRDQLKKSGVFAKGIRKYVRSLVDMGPPNHTRPFWQVQRVANLGPAR